MGDGVLVNTPRSLMIRLNAYFDYRGLVKGEVERLQGNRIWNLSVRSYCG
jgi:hypothetical protein